MQDGDRAESARAIILTTVTARAQAEGIFGRRFLLLFSRKCQGCLLVLGAVIWVVPAQKRAGNNFYFYYS
jgi:hypothetical protein